MNKARKTKLYVILIALVCVIAFCLCACSGVGADGANGTNGKDGSNGKSAYEIWLDEGHTGSQADFLNWLKGTDGKDGQNGLNGQDGSDGSNGQDGVDGSNGQNGTDGRSAYQIFMQQYPYYRGTEEQWLISLVNGRLRIHEIKFKSEVADDMVRYVVGGYPFTDIPDVPEKEGQTSAAWSVTDFSSITEDIEVTAVYDMRKYVTFHNEFTDDEDVVITVEYGEAITDIPQITAKVGNDSTWSITDFGEIKTDLFVETVYETQGLQYTLINQQTQYKVSKGDMDVETTEELFIPATYNGKPVTIVDTNAFSRNALYSPPFLFKRAYLPDTITEIRNSAFDHCGNLAAIRLPKNLICIGSGAFA